MNEYFVKPSPTESVSEFSILQSEERKRAKLTERTQKPNRLETLLVLAALAAKKLCESEVGTENFELGIELFVAVERLRE
jgi:hypothetical protein